MYLWPHFPPCTPSVIVYLDLQYHITWHQPSDLVPLRYITMDCSTTERLNCASNCLRSTHSKTKQQTFAALYAHEQTKSRCPSSSGIVCYFYLHHEFRRPPSSFLFSILAKLDIVAHEMKSSEYDSIRSVS